jgi:hypothetical protein
VQVSRKARRDEHGDEDGFVHELEDQGVADKRLLVAEGELARALKVMRREGNTLSPVVRSLWDNGKVGALTKNTQTKTAAGSGSARCWGSWPSA